MPTTHNQKPIEMPTTVTLDEGYKAMAADLVRETEAVEWCEAFNTEAGAVVHPFELL